MLSLDLGAWELMARAAAVYVLLLVMMRLSGKRTVGQFTPFDLLVVMLVSEAAGPSMVGDDHSLTGGLLVCAVLIALNAAVAFITTRSRAAETLLEGEAVLLGRDGQIFEQAPACAIAWRATTSSRRCARPTANWPTCAWPSWRPTVASASRSSPRPADAAVSSCPGLQ